QYIGGHAFAYSGLKSITVPSKITAVSSEAFTDCKKLKDIVIPAALQYTAGYLSKKTVKKERV
ncbi:MAG: leucine-rich repeat domain-containing protein, partial [Clostridiales bacterium]|nr:leucine-rich repeat domain-containing protein [Clostridiales bacterium]